MTHKESKNLHIQFFTMRISLKVKIEFDSKGKSRHEV